jgi:hypothetical protein
LNIFITSIAKVIGLGASFLGIAGVGIKIVTTLRTFGASFLCIQQNQPPISWGRAHGVHSNRAKNVVKEYEVELHLRVENFEPAKSVVEGCFERLSAALNEPKKDDDQMSWNYSVKGSSHSLVPGRGV